MGLEFKNLGSDVGVQPGELGPGLSHQAAQHGFHLVGIEAELAVQVTGADVFVRVALDAWGEAQHQAGRFGSSGHQFGEAIKIVLGQGEPLVGRLLTYESLKMQFRTLKLRKDPSCPVCGDEPTITEYIDYNEFCAR